MHPLIHRKRGEVADLCKQFRVRRLDLFGSAARGDFDPASSDLDFLVEFEPISPAAYADAYFSFKEGLEALFNRQVDLITASSVVNPYFRAGLSASRESIYAA
jgi:predicted nucleotidyltransferase